ncbi:MAG: hypothetical protein GWM90_19620 [Gemmatimonadetes bacterium]|nr:hypothetical protein [Gemmatimonadota bacterium]NIQ56639.1 hypothetical protein [Gemmatimonadota bacterium]NIU68315.1 hypothetical protein [Actinomycetota bacterium]NIW30138.1 hypothetical protein [Actinomycetota bacterium]NIX46213.1 hypothetical protein [Gemmatimonadota bacterium]
MTGSGETTVTRPDATRRGRGGARLVVETGARAPEETPREMERAWNES